MKYLRHDSGFNSHKWIYRLKPAEGATQSAGEALYEQIPAAKRAMFFDTFVKHRAGGQSWRSLPGETRTQHMVSFLQNPHNGKYVREYIDELNSSESVRKVLKDLATDINAHRKRMKALRAKKPKESKFEVPRFIPDYRAMAMVRKPEESVDQGTSPARPQPIEEHPSAIPSEEPPELDSMDEWVMPAPDGGVPVPPAVPDIPADVPQETGEEFLEDGVEEAQIAGDIAVLSPEQAQKLAEIGAQAAQNPDGYKMPDVMAQPAPVPAPNQPVPPTNVPGPAPSLPDVLTNPEPVPQPTEPRHDPTQVGPHTYPESQIHRIGPPEPPKNASQDLRKSYTEYMEARKGSKAVIDVRENTLEPSIEHNAEYARHMFVRIARAAGSQHEGALALGSLPLAFRKEYIPKIGYPQYNPAADENPNPSTPVTNYEVFSAIWKNPAQLCQLCAIYMTKNPSVARNLTLGFGRGETSPVYSGPGYDKLSPNGLVRFVDGPDGTRYKTINVDISRRKAYSKVLTPRPYSVNPVRNYMEYQDTDITDVVKASAEADAALMQAFNVQGFLHDMKNVQQKFFDGGAIRGGIVGGLINAMKMLFNGGKDDLTLGLEKVFAKHAPNLKPEITRQHFGYFLEVYNYHVEKFQYEIDLAYSILDEVRDNPNMTKLSNPKHENFIMKLFGIGDRQRIVPMLRANNDLFRQGMLYRGEAIVGGIINFALTGGIPLWLGMIKNPWAIERVFRGPGIDAVSCEFMGVKATDVLEREIQAHEKFIGTSMDFFGKPGFMDELKKEPGQRKSRVEGSIDDINLDKIYQLTGEHLAKVGLRLNQEKTQFVIDATFARKKLFTIPERIFGDAFGEKKNATARDMLKAINEGRCKGKNLVKAVQCVYNILRDEYIDDYGVTPEGYLVPGRDHRVPGYPKMRIRHDKKTGKCTYMHEQQVRKRVGGPRGQIRVTQEWVECTPQQHLKKGAGRYPGMGLMIQKNQDHHVAELTKNMKHISTAMGDPRIMALSTGDKGEQAMMAELKRSEVIIESLVDTELSLKRIGSVAKNATPGQAATFFVLGRTNAEGFANFFAPAISPPLLKKIQTTFYGPDGDPKTNAYSAILELEKMGEPLQGEFNALMANLAGVSEGNWGGYNAMLQANLEARFKDHQKVENLVKRSGPGAYGPDLTKHLEMRDASGKLTGKLNRQKLYEFYRDAETEDGMHVGTRTLMQLHCLAGVDISADEFLHAIRCHSRVCHVDKGINTAFDTKTLKGFKHPYSGPGIIVEFPGKVFQVRTPNGEIELVRNPKIFIKPGCANLGICCDSIQDTINSGTHITDHQAFYRHKRFALFITVGGGGGQTGGGDGGGGGGPTKTPAPTPPTAPPPPGVTVPVKVPAPTIPVAPIF